MPPSKKPKAKNRSPLDDPKGFQQSLVGWFQKEAKDYPWRQTTDPYAILVSEFMLQQTQIATVLERGYYTRWMAAFPDFATLAAASEEAVLKAWEGLGYYRRARNLQKLAQTIVSLHSGKMPTAPAAVLELPGIGRYTAGALLSFAYNHPAALVDGNVARVFSRLFNYADPVDAVEGQQKLWTWAERLVAGTSNARAYNAALMELGQRLCTQKSPACSRCPVLTFCGCDDPEKLPQKSARRETVFLDEHALFAQKDGQVLLAQEQGKRRQGLWKLPERDLDALPKSAALVYKAKYSITHHRVTLHVYQPSEIVDPIDSECWHPKSALATLAMPSPYRKAVDRLVSLDDGEFALS